jgi:hypothetical protein
MSDMPNLITFLFISFSICYEPNTNKVTVDTIDNAVCNVGGFFGGSGFLHQWNWPTGYNFIYCKGDAQHT